MTVQMGLILSHCPLHLHFLISFLAVLVDLGMWQQALMITCPETTDLAMTPHLNQRVDKLFFVIFWTFCSHSVKVHFYCNLHVAIYGQYLLIKTVGNWGLIWLVSEDFSKKKKQSFVPHLQVNHLSSLKVPFQKMSKPTSRRTIWNSGRGLQKSKSLEDGIKLELKFPEWLGGHTICKIMKPSWGYGQITCTCIDAMYLHYSHQSKRCIHCHLHLMMLLETLNYQIFLNWVGEILVQLTLWGWSWQLPRIR